MTKGVRRVVTGHNNQGESIILLDEQAKNIDRPVPVAPDNVLINLWMTDRSPADISKFSDPALNKIPLAPPPQGNILRFVDFPPESTFIHKLDQKVVDQTWAHLKSDQKETKKERHPLMHKTKTIDYIIVLFGEIYLILDNGETLLKPGDVVIQRGTNHAWSNRTKEICRVAAVLVDASYE